MPGLYLEAEHHGVWRRRTGELVDVTPQPGSPKRVLFLPDDDAPYDPAAFRSNRLAPDGGDPASVEFAALGNLRNAIHDSYRAGGARLALFSASDRAELARIDVRIAELMGAWRARRPLAR